MLLKRIKNYVIRKLGGFTCEEIQEFLNLPQKEFDYGMMKYRVKKARDKITYEILRNTFN